MLSLRNGRHVHMAHQGDVTFRKTAGCEVVAGSRSAGVSRISRLIMCKVRFNIAVALR